MMITYVRRNKRFDQMSLNRGQKRLSNSLFKKLIRYDSALKVRSISKLLQDGLDDDIMLRMCQNLRKLHDSSKTMNNKKRKNNENESI